MKIGIAAKVGETTILYALSLIVEIKSKFVAQSEGSDKKKKIDKEAKRTKIGNPNATRPIANKTFVHRNNGLAKGNCQKYRTIVGIIEKIAKNNLYFKSELLVRIIWYQIKINPRGIIDCATQVGIKGAIFSGD